MALPRKVALCPVVSGGMVLRYWWVGGVEGVMWLGPCEIAADFCPMRLLRGDCGILLAGERRTGVSPRRLLGVSAQEERYAVMRFSAVRLSTNLMTSFRKKLINLSAIRPETTTAITFSDTLHLLNMVCNRVDHLGEKKKKCHS